jgi:hypothetical protein
MCVKGVLRRTRRWGCRECRNPGRCAAGPFQEIAIVGHGLADFETDGFATFLKKAVESFLGLGKPARLKRSPSLSTLGCCNQCP